MLRWLRNVITFFAMLVLASLLFLFISTTAIASLLPNTWSTDYKYSMSFGIAVALAVLPTSLLLALLLQTTRHAWWIIAFSVVWAAVALFPIVSWWFGSQGRWGVKVGTMTAWGPLLALFSGLLGLRLAALARNRRSTSRANPAAG